MSPKFMETTINSSKLCNELFTSQGLNFLEAYVTKFCCCVKTQHNFCLHALQYILNFFASNRAKIVDKVNFLFNSSRLVLHSSFHFNTHSFLDNLVSGNEMQENPLINFWYNI